MRAFKTFKQLAGLCLGCVLALVELSCAQRGNDPVVVGQTQNTQSQLALPGLKTRAQHFLSHEDLTANSAAVLIGQRLFRETRFSQYFFANSAGNPNAELPADDVLMKYIKTPSGSTPNPYAQLGGINCASCHLIDEAKTVNGAGMRSYTDFLPRSFIPERGDGLATTLRNAPTMVNFANYKGRLKLFHSDGQFGTLEALVGETFIGRNFGWLASESLLAQKNLVTVIRLDSGLGALARDYGGAYATILRGADPSIPDSFRLPPEFRIDVNRASDAKIAATVSKLVATFIESLNYSTDRDGTYNGSPYDLFLKKNKLPQRPEMNESDRAYGARLLSALQKLKAVRFVSPLEKSFAFQSQEFLFGETELTGLKLFLTTKSASAGQSGNCVHCHAPPHFTDFGFHNTGLSQVEYDSVHGQGKFLSLPIPTLTQRNQNPQLLPTTPDQPLNLGVYAQIPSAGNPALVDLGFWNVFANSDPSVQSSQHEIARQLCEEIQTQHQGTLCQSAELLSRAIARFKTPSLRDLGQSSPYGHNGTFQKIDQAVNFYRKASELQRHSQLRNGDTALENIHLSENSVLALSAFLRSLNEDYH